MEEGKKYFLVEIDTTKKWLEEIAEHQEVSFEQVTDELLCKTLQDDLATFNGTEIKVSKLDKPSA